MLDEMHLRKIDLADEIFVINVGGYIGSSTKNEIEYAISTNKQVKYLEETNIKNGDKVRYKIENEISIERDSLIRLSKKFQHKHVYPYSYKSGEWFVVNRVSGDMFDFEGAEKYRIGIIPFTLSLFPNDEWEWDIS